MTEERIEEMFKNEWQQGMCDFCCDTDQWIVIVADQRTCRGCLESGKFDQALDLQGSNQDFQNAMFEHLKDADALCEPAAGCMYCATRADELREEEKAYQLEISRDRAMQLNGHWDFDMREAMPPVLCPAIF